MGDLSPHFSLWEFADKRTGCAPLPPERLVALLEVVREQYGRPVRIVSGHRCPSSNEKVGGASHSRHLFGDAVDIEKGILNPLAARELGFTGIGVKLTWAVHLDIRPGGLTIWRY